jgi:murein DD-endopeptidase MepM/ murein hydrolase activator NlpD
MNNENEQQKSEYIFDINEFYRSNKEIIILIALSAMYLLFIWYNAVLSITERDIDYSVYDVMKEPEDLSLEYHIESLDKLKSKLLLEIDESEVKTFMSLLKSFKVNDKNIRGKKITIDFDTNKPRTLEELAYIDSIRAAKGELMEDIENLPSDFESFAKKINVAIIEITPNNKIVIKRDSNNKLEIEAINIPYKKILIRYDLKITSDISKSFDAIGLPKSTYAEIVNVINNMTDIKANLKRGDNISVITEKFYTDNDQFKRFGKIIYLSFKSKNSNYNLYRYKHNGVYEYFDDYGKSIKVSSFRNPLNSYRISSHFGLRTDPFLKIKRMHKGTDFSAPKGTPVFAASEGVIVDAGYHSGYGYMVKIKHQGGIETLYGHLSSINQGVKRGVKIAKGALIGKVGSSGRSTNPHLHFEIIHNKKHVNPVKFKSASAPKVLSSRTYHFNKYKEEVKNLSTTLKSISEVNLNSIKYETIKKEHE